MLSNLLQLEPVALYDSVSLKIFPYDARVYDQSSRFRRKDFTIEITNIDYHDK